MGSIRPFDLVLREALKFGQSEFPGYGRGRDKGLPVKEFRPFKEFLCCPFPEVIGVEEDMSFIYEEEHVLIRIVSLRDQDIANERKRVVGGCDFYLIVCPEIVDDFSLPVHVTMDSKEFRI